MISKIITKIIGSRNDRLVKKMRKQVSLINELEAQISALDDTELRAQTKILQEAVGKGKSLDELLPQAFAIVREAGKRVLGMRHFDVQMIGAMVLHQGKIAEMRTGEGKTLVATLAVYLNALAGKGVHVVTVNDYLARRDAEWMGRIYHFLGLSVGIINSSGRSGPDSGSYQFDPDYLPTEEGQYLHLRPVSRKEAYATDITYGTNNEFGFDYLRDNLAFSLNERVQRELYFAVVDEVDSILIDEARTPLIISGPSEDTSQLYAQINELIPKLTRQERMAEKDEEELPGDYAVDEKNRQVFLSDEGHQHVEELLTEAGLLAENSSLYDPANIMLMHHINAALRAHSLFERNVDYIVRKDQVIIVDEFTGRTMEGRRWSEGLHQAVEAKEKVEVQRENQTVASITFQNYFRMYEKLSGMTGTADTEAVEFQQIYNLEVVVIPTHRDMIRTDFGDQVYLDKRQKFNAIVQDIKDCRERGQPVLVGTTSIENSELLADLLQKENIPHQVLNAKQHEREAEIIAQAGRPGSVTIATNMAGRGTDIVLGGNLDAQISALQNPTAEEIEQCRANWQQQHQQVLESGGLHVIGTERHESRRVDNQLRGRSGRQGDQGSSRFYLSLEDPLMRIFASDWVASVMQRLGMEEGEAIEHRWVTNTIEKAQRKVEGRNFDIRKQLLEFDDVANDQRRVIYSQRRDIMEADKVDQGLNQIRHTVVNQIIDQFIPPNTPDEMWRIDELEQALHKQFFIKLPISQWLHSDEALHEQSLREKIVTELQNSYEKQAAILDISKVRNYEKALMLQTLDKLWKEHLAAMDYLRQSIHLRGYAQKNPKQEYKREAFEMFRQLLLQIEQEVLAAATQEIFQASERLSLDLAQLETQQRTQQTLNYRHAPASALKAGMGKAGEDEEHTAPPVGPRPEEAHHQPFVRDHPKVGRNEPCPCGSGKKYKHCHGKIAD